MDMRTESADYDVKYRPRDLDDVVGQPAAVAVIKGWKKDVPRATLLSGLTGCGKTTLARIVTDKVLGVGKVDLREINCAIVESAVNLVRDINQHIGNWPIQGAYRAWILDEMQSFGTTGQGQNALLKILEECPKHVRFFLCTTNPEKIIPAIRGRCKIVEVKPVAPAALVPFLKRVAKQEHIDPVPDDRLYDAICDKSNGSVRDALAMLQNAAGVADPALRLETISTFGNAKEAFDLAKALMPFKGEPSWPDVQQLLGKLTDVDPEGCRRVIMATARTRLVNPKTRAEDCKHLCKVIRCLADPLFDRTTGHPLLAAACYQIVFAGR
jgi:DNA polymerase III subunit gamma/tau